MPATQRILWLLTMGWGAALIWLSPHPPMVDLPQHAAQIGTLRDWLTGGSAWHDELTANFATPYLTMYGSTLALSTVLPLLAALKVVLTLAYLGFVGFAMMLRMELDADPRMDWLMLVSFFGFAWKWGFASFLVASPIGLAFIWLTLRHLRQPNLASTLRLVLVGSLLLVSHGLVFVFAWLVAALLMCLTPPLRGERALVIAPLALCALVCLAYTAIAWQSQQALAIGVKIAPEGEWTWRRVQRLAGFSFDDGVSTWHLIASAAALTAPWLMGLRLNRRDRRPYALLIVFAVAFFVVPGTAMDTAFLYHRFALFFLPAVGLLFVAAERTARWHLSGTLATLMLIGACWVPLYVHSTEALAFKRESADFRQVLAVLEPGRRLLYLPFDTDSAVITHGSVYAHFASWYQAERGGFVDPNFAWYPPQILRFKKEFLPRVEPGLEWHVWKFDWNRHQGIRYDYFLLRGAAPTNVADLFRGAECPPEQVIQQGMWRVYRKADCTATRARRQAP